MSIMNIGVPNTYFMKVRLLFLFLFLSTAAQAQFTFSGKIEYERKMNLHRQLEGNEWMEKFKSQLPKFLTHYFDLTFAPGVTYYQQGREIEQPKMMMGGDMGLKTQVYTDLAHDQVTAAKQVFEQKFLVKDSVRQMRWRITDEVRDIANFKCRKAVGIILDSVYVVAFYTDDIPVSGGPEMFAGLPGMILELAIPRLYTTWIATKVDVVAVNPADLKAPDKGKTITQKELLEKLIVSTSQWGDMGKMAIWWSVL